MDELYFYYSCGHRELDIDSLRTNKMTMTRCIDTYCSSCQNEEHHQRAQDYARDLDKLTDEEWEAHQKAYFERGAKICAEHPEWTTDAVALETEKQQIEALKLENADKQQRVTPVLVVENASESADLGGDGVPEWVDGENDEIIRDRLHPLHAWLIIEELAASKRVFSGSFDQEFKEENSEDKQVVALGEYLPSTSYQK